MILMAALLAPLLTLFFPLDAATLTVSDCSAPSGAPGRLVEVITAAAAGDTVVFSCSGAITLTATITIDKNLTIDGAGQSVTISGGNAVRVFTISAGITFNLQNLTVANGLAMSHGGGVYNSGALTVTNVTFSGNTADGGAAAFVGGGIYNSSTGTLDVLGSTFSGNSADVGGGIYNLGPGTVYVSNTTFSGNSARSAGALFSAGTANVTNSTFSDNTATNFAGALYSAGTATVTNSTFSGNFASAGGGGITGAGGVLNVTGSTFSGNWTTSSGGGITNWNGSTLNVTDSTFSGNSATNNGGGINNDGTLTATNSAFSGNGAGAGGGGIYGTGKLKVVNSTFSTNDAGAAGGGIANSGGGTLDVTNSTFSGNSAFRAGGGISNDGTLTVTNSTFSGNSAYGASPLSGGGIYNSAGTVTVTNSTFSGNSASQGSGIRGPATLKNTIVANSTAGGNCSGTITDGGGNLQFGGAVANSCGASIPTADPKLSTLADNGGATQTMALGAGSAALNAADYATCMAAVGSPNFGAGGLDQRGQTRSSAGSACDTGAFEQQTGDITLTVTDCSAPSGAPGRLVEVITAAPAGGMVVFACSGEITLTSTLIIGKNLSIDGAGQSVTLSGGDTVRAFTVNAGVTLHLQNLNVAHGKVANSFGGGVYNNGGSLYITNVTFFANSASSGGGIYSTGALNVTDSSFSSNTATSRGGGIASTGVLTVTNSVFSGNTANYSGGGVDNYYGTLSVKNSTFSGNNGPFGGGIINWIGASTVTDTTFSGNNGSYGGGFANWGGTATLTNDTVSGNSGGAGGGVYNWEAGILMVTNSTFSGNSGNGGGIYGSGTLTVTNSTFSDNSGGAINAYPYTTTVRNTIIANSVASQNCNWTLIDGGGNLQFGGAVANSCGASIPTADPKLSTLADNGGATQTMALLPDSPVINAANPANCPATDQRGVERGSSCDVGAYEYLGVATGSVSPPTGGTIALADGTFTIIFPPNAVTTTVTVTYAQALSPTQPLPTGRIGLDYFTLEAYDGGGNLVTNFNQPYTLTLTYTDAELAAAGITEATLIVSFWNGSAWVDMLPCAGCGIDAANNRLTIVANHFSDFALVGQTTTWLFLPLIVR